VSRSSGKKNYGGEHWKDKIDRLMEEEKKIYFGWSPPYRFSASAVSVGRHCNGNWAWTRQSRLNSGYDTDDAVWEIWKMKVVGVGGQVLVTSNQMATRRNASRPTKKPS
jgi:hypothetical protein